MRITRTFKFDAAHLLPGHPGKCRNLHGHTWKVELTLEGPIGADGMVMDFSELKRIWTDNMGHLDHSSLNDFIATPTAERIVEYVVENMIGVAPIVEVTVWESDESRATWRIERGGP